MHLLGWAFHLIRFGCCLHSLNLRLRCLRGLLWLCVSVLHLLACLRLDCCLGLLRLWVVLLCGCRHLGLCRLPSFELLRFPQLHCRLSPHPCVGVHLSSCEGAVQAGTER